MPQTSDRNLSMVLNLDVILSIMHFVEGRCDLLSVMQTCRTLFSAGFAHLLRPPLRFTSLHPFTSFCRFMLIDTPHSSRFQCLKNLDLCFFNARPAMTVGSEVVALFSRALAIKVLKINRAEYFFESGEGISEAISSLTSLEILEMGGLGDLSTAMIRAMQSTLKRISLSSVNPNTLLEDLQDLRGCLEDISLRYPSSTLVITDPFLHVRCLSIESSYDSQIEPFVKSFPNLERLSIKSAFIDSNFSDVEIDNLHRTNIAAQKIAGWDGLKFIYGSPTVLYFLGLSCHGGDLHLGILRTYRYLHPILSHSRPSRLKLTIHTPSFPSASLPGILQVAHRLELTYLRIRLKYLHLSTLLRHIPPLMQLLETLSVTHLSIGLLGSNLSQVPQTHESWESSLVYQGRNKLGLDSFPDQVAQKVSDLRYLHIFWSSRESLHWRISRHNGAADKVILEKIPDALGEEIMYVEDF